MHNITQLSCVHGPALGSRIKPPDAGIPVKSGPLKIAPQLSNVQCIKNSHNFLVWCPHCPSSYSGAHWIDRKTNKKNCQSSPLEQLDLLLLHHVWKRMLNQFFWGLYRVEGPFGMWSWGEETAWPLVKVQPTMRFQSQLSMCPNSQLVSRPWDSMSKTLLHFQVHAMFKYIVTTSDTPFGVPKWGTTYFKMNTWNDISLRTKSAAHR